MNISTKLDNNSQKNDVNILNQGIRTTIKSLKEVKSFELMLDTTQKDAEEMLSEDLEIEQPPENDENKVILSEIDARLLQNMQIMMLKDAFPNDIQENFNNKILLRTEKLFIREENSIDISSLKRDDIDLFKKLADGQEFSIQSFNPEKQQLNIIIDNNSNQVSYKSLDVSKSLFELIEHAYNTQRPVRLDFDGNSSVILKIDKDGKLSAQFMSSDKAMEYILKSAIPSLRQKFDNEGLPYKQIAYKESEQQNKKHNHNNKNGG